MVKELNLPETPPPNGHRSYGHSSSILELLQCNIETYITIFFQHAYLVNRNLVQINRIPKTFLCVWKNLNRVGSLGLLFIGAQINGLIRAFSELIKCC